MRRALALGFLGWLLLAAPAFADAVYLKTGQVLHGRVIDAGDFIILEQDLGSLRIPKAEIARIEVDAAAAPATGGEDEVILQDRSVLRGRVRPSDDGTHLIVEGALGSVEIPRENVQSIRWAASSGTPAGAESIRDRVHALVTDLAGPDATVHERAAAGLQDLGMFAVPYLQEILAGDVAPEVRSVIEAVLERQAILAATDPEILLSVPHLVDRLTGASPIDRRTQALQDAVLASPRGATPLLVEIVEDAHQPPEVQSFAIGHLVNLRRLDALLDLVESSPPGPATVAAAIGLGDNGVYAGIPLLIASLRHPDLTVRQLADAKLREYTGEFMGFFPEEQDPERREVAIARWEAWWQAHQEEFMARSRAALDPGATATEDMERGMGLWRQGNAVWEAADQATDRDFEIDKARYFLEQAVEAYPSFPNARISLAALLYLERSDLEGARAQLEMVCDRFRDDAGALALLHARYHLGRVFMLLGRWDDARQRLQQAADSDPTLVDARIALGDLGVAEAYASASLLPEDRRSLIEGAVLQYAAAAERLEAARREFSASSETYVEVNRATPFAGGRFRSDMREAVAATTRDLARVHHLLGRALIALHRRPDALAELRAATELDPENAEYQADLATCQGAPDIEERVREAGGPNLPTPATPPDQEVPATPGALAPVVDAERQILAVWRRVRSGELATPEDQARAISEVLEAAVRGLSAPPADLPPAAIEASCQSAWWVEQVRTEVSQAVSGGQLSAADGLRRAATVLRETERRLRAATEGNAPPPAAPAPTEAPAPVPTPPPAPTR